MKNRDNFVEKSYEELPLENVLGKYQEEGIDEAVIFSRLQNLENHFQKLNFKRRGKELLYRESNIELGRIEEELEPLRNLKKRAYDKRDIKEKFRIKKNLELEREKILKKIQERDSQRKISSYKTRKFDENFEKELEYIYSKKIVSENFAWLRLIKPGKFRIGEPLLMAQYGIIPLESLFNCEYLDSTDRRTLFNFVPQEMLEKRLGELPIRIKSLKKLIEDAEDLEKMETEYKWKKEKINERIDDLDCEQIFLEEYLNDR